MAEMVWYILDDGEEIKIPTYLLLRRAASKPA